MDLSGLLIRIIFLLLPGAIGRTLYRKLRGRVRRKDWEDLIEIIIFSLISYVLYALLLYLLNTKWETGIEFTAFEAFFNERVAIRWQDVLCSSLLSVVLALVASYAYQFNVVNRTGRLIGATTRFGDEDVWDFFHHSPNVRGGWITIRDHKLNLYYFGWVEAFSDSGKERELLLREVSVHDNSSGDCIYKTDALYLSRKQDDLTLEVTLVSNNLQKPTIELTEADAPDRMDVEDKASIESTSDPREEGVGHEKSKSS